ncbi:MAG: DUF4340 domain-containing protein [Anaerolineae bacterium]|nr:DUF4340 domain-containing protein [Anaerolineae bacterium]
MTPTKRLVVALVFLLIAAGIFIVVNKVDLGGTEDDVATPTPRALLFPDIQGEVTMVRVTDNTTQDVFVVEKKEEAWAILEAPEGSDTGLGVDEMRITNALTAIPGLQPSRTLTSLESLATYGLGDEAEYNIVFTIGPDDYTLIVGSKNPGGTDYYVQLSTASNVHLISTYSLDSIIRWLTDPPYIQPTPDPNVTPSATPDEGSTSG